MSSFRASLRNLQLIKEKYKIEMHFYFFQTTLSTLRVNKMLVKHFVAAYVNHKTEDRALFSSGNESLLFSYDSCHLIKKCADKVKTKMAHC